MQHFELSEHHECRIAVLERRNTWIPTWEILDCKAINKPKGCLPSILGDKQPGIFLPKEKHLPNRSLSAIVPELAAPAVKVG